MPTLTLDGVDLVPHGSHMRWVDKWQSQGVVQSVTETLGGGLIIYAQSLPAGRNITLVADENYGWLSHAILEQLKAMANEPGGIFTLNVNGVEYSVMFRHHEPPALDALNLVPRLNETAGDFYTGVIKLITV